MPALFMGWLAMCEALHITADVLLMAANAVGSRHGLLG
jgi:hypothetical protein